MCDICLSSPCLPGCPNEQEIAVYACYNCGDDILIDDYYYEIDGRPWCAGCIHDCRKVADLDQGGKYYD